jgi:hypothetical protein
MDIEKLIEEYDMKGIDTPQLVRMAQRYVISMPDQQVRVILYLLSNEIERLSQRLADGTGCMICNFRERRACWEKGEQDCVEIEQLRSENESLRLKSTDKSEIE